MNLLQTTDSLIFNFGVPGKHNSLKCFAQRKAQQFSAVCLLAEKSLLHGLRILMAIHGPSEVRKSEIDFLLIIRLRRIGPEVEIAKLLGFFRSEPSNVSLCVWLLCFHSFQCHQS